MKKAAILFLAVLFLTGCARQSNKWVGFYYPEGKPTQGKASCEIKEFDTQETCRQWATAQKKDNGKADYYCGFQCHYDSSCQYACTDAK